MTFPGMSSCMFFFEVKEFKVVMFALWFIGVGSQVCYVLDYASPICSVFLFLNWVFQFFLIGLL